MYTAYLSILLLSLKDKLKSRQLSFLGPSRMDNLLKAHI